MLEEAEEEKEEEETCIMREMMTMVEHYGLPPETISFPVAWGQIEQAVAAAKRQGLNVQTHESPAETTYLSPDVYARFAADHPDVEHHSCAERN